MKVVESIEELRKTLAEARAEGRTIGFVATMGALHDGHLALVRKSRESGDFTVVSIFVNPTQFGPTEDYRRYPRALESDVEKCAAEGVDIIFAPPVEEMYPPGFATYVAVGGIAEKLEGASRPGHFRGVATIVLKLFAAVEPRRAYFGMKDYQQLMVIDKMVHDLNLDIEIVPVPTVREQDGLAMSSRNAYLSPDQRNAAGSLYRALLAAKTRIDAGERDANAIRRAAEAVIESAPLASIDYVAVVDPQSLQPLARVRGPVLVALAVRVGKTRLIDNMIMAPKEASHPTPGG